MVVATPRRVLLATCVWLGVGCGQQGLAPPTMPPATEHVIVNDVDVLFMMDNSPGTSPKQQELKNRLPAFLKTLEDFGKTNPLSIHFGVVTSDMGAGQFNIGNGQCHPGGDGGKLQAIGHAADPSCQAPTGRLSFVDYDQITGTNNLPSGQDLGTTLDCMLSVGNTGCGFEAPLESVYQALANPPPENHDFLRPNALLVVLWMTDEDDCSADPNTDLFDPNATQYGALLSYRCTNYSIACGTPPMLMPYGDSGGNRAPCQDADPSVNKLIPVQKYIDFFTKPASQGGVKVDPRMVVLADISAPTDFVESLVVQINAQPPGPYVPGCSGPIDGKTCAVVLQHSCIATSNTAFMGDPAVRLRQVVGAARNNQSTSVCDTSYQAAVQSLGQLIISQTSAGCVDAPFDDVAAASCTVENVTIHDDGTTSSVELPRCDQVDAATSCCWTLESKPVCDATTLTQGCCPTVCAHDGDPGQHFGVSVSCPGGLPSNTIARWSCATVPPSADAQTGMLPACGAPL